MGAGRYLRQYNPAIQIVGVQPEAAFHGLEGLKHMPTEIQPGIFDADFPDHTLGIDTEAAYRMTLRLARQEGLFVGVSSGAAAVAALQIASQLKEGVVVAVFPDAGYKYLSEKFWERER
jgi:cysteine synthase B